MAEDLRVVIHNLHSHFEYVDDYYDGALTASGRIFGGRVFFVCDDEDERRYRRYAAHVLTEEMWAILDERQRDFNLYIGNQTERREPGAPDAPKPKSQWVNFTGKWGDFSSYDLVKDTPVIGYFWDGC